MAHVAMRCKPVPRVSPQTPNAKHHPGIRSPNLQSVGGGCVTYDCPRGQHFCLSIWQSLAWRWSCSRYHASHHSFGADESSASERSLVILISVLAPPVASPMASFRVQWPSAFQRLVSLQSCHYQTRRQDCGLTTPVAAELHGCC